MKTFQKLLLLIPVFWLNMLNAQEYAVRNIPENLKKDAYAVVRKDATKVEFTNFDKVKYSNHHVITILNESGLRYAFIPLYYGKRMNIVKFTATLYDQNGKEIRKLKSKDLKDISVYDDGALYNDYRFQYYEFTPTSYPFTVEYYQEYTTSNTISIPGWTPVDSYDVGIESSTYNLTNSSSINIRKKESGFEDWNVTKFEQGNSLNYSVQNIEPLQEEALSPVLSELTPKLSLIPDKFQLEGVEGSFENWKQFGKWYYENLLKNKRELSQKDKQAVSQLIKGVNDPIEKIRILYQFMQSKTRYVNVSVGIGGWEPFPATYVSDKSYGDCKALSNYMISLLNFVGIDAFYTIVYGNPNRKQNMDKDFASLQGNHIIVNVPLNDETIWLECTNQQTAFNYLGSFTNDRYAVSVKPEGAEIISTQKFPAAKNIEKINGNGELFPGGKLKMNLKIEDSGLQYDDVFQIYYKSEKDQTRMLKNQFSHLPNTELKNYEFTNDRNNAVFTTTIQIESNQYATIVGNDLMINLIPTERRKSGLKKDNHRKYPFDIKYGYTDILDFDLKLPTNYKISEDFKDIVFLDKFGSYQMSVRLNEDGNLNIYRVLMIKDGSYQKEDYNDFVEFLRKLSSFDNSKLLLEKTKS